MLLRSSSASCEPPRPPLAYELFETACLEEAMGRRFAGSPRWENLRPRERFYGRLRYARLSGAAICHFESRSWLRYVGAMPQSYFVSIAERGVVTHEIRGETVASTPQRAIVHDAGAEIRTETGPRRHLGLLLPKDLVLREASLRLDREVTALEFDPELDLTAGAGATFAHFVRFLDAELARPGGFPRGSRTTELLESSLVNLLLDAQPFTVAGVDAGSKSALDGGPRVVRRVDELIRTRTTHPLSVGDLAAHAGVSARTLFRTYRRYRGRSPIQALRDARLEQARRALTEAVPETSVTEVAIRCGFTHLGRFSQAYRRTFGEAPSETLRRARASISE